jgi:excisionase family DNA binding protein
MQAIYQSISRPLTTKEARQVEQSNTELTRLLGIDGQSFQTATLHLIVESLDGKKTEFDLPGKTLVALKQMLNELCNGKADSEVTTQQAADFLRVSRPYFVKLLEDGRIPFRKVGPRRRVLMSDLIRYRDIEEAERHRGLDELVREAQNLGMY